MILTHSDVHSNVMQYKRYQAIWRFYPINHSFTVVVLCRSLIRQLCTHCRAQGHPGNTLQPCDPAKSEHLPEWPMQPDPMRTQHSLRSERQEHCALQMRCQFCPRRSHHQRLQAAVSQVRTAAGRSVSCKDGSRPQCLRWGRQQAAVSQVRTAAGSSVSCEDGSRPSVSGEDGCRPQCLRWDNSSRPQCLRFNIGSRPQCLRWGWLQVAVSQVGQRLQAVVSQVRTAAGRSVSGEDGSRPQCLRWDNSSRPQCLRFDIGSRPQCHRWDNGCNMKYPRTSYKFQKCRNIITGF